ncbi:MAG: hypothetical protein ACREBG_23390, partial [Pyrinomonadaceae bacterium]
TRQWSDQEKKTPLDRVSFHISYDQYHLSPRADLRAIRASVVNNGYFYHGDTENTEKQTIRRRVGQK